MKKEQAKEWIIRPTDSNPVTTSAEKPVLSVNGVKPDKNGDVILPCVWDRMIMQMFEI